jgi:hypothetical protein
MVSPRWKVSSRHELVVGELLDQAPAVLHELTEVTLTGDALESAKIAAILVEIVLFGHGGFPDRREYPRPPDRVNRRRVRPPPS